MKDLRLVLIASAFGAILYFPAVPARAVSAHGTGAETQIRTLRVDYFHTGNATTEMFSLDRVGFEPLPWAGNPRRPFDDTNLGLYFFEVVDRETNRTIYSRGFASIFGEWQTTDEAKERWGTFSESFRFPAPYRPFRISLKKRDAKNDFYEIWSVAVDPADMFVDTSVTNAPAALLALEEHGDPSDKVDLLILGDGYTKEERPKFEKDARRMIEMLFAQEPFKSHRSDFNVWGLSPAALESGISRPSTGIHRRNPVGATYDAFGSERYVLTFDNRAFREAAQFAPYDFVEILVNAQTYGGGGIFGLYGTVAADSVWAPYIFVHEFGHHFAGLADEYYTSDVATTNGTVVEPWEKNVTANADPATIKWKALLSPGTPVPTPWKKAEFEAFQKDIQARRRKIRADRLPESEMDALFREEQAHETELLGKDAHSGKVGAFEGASYQATGMFRPQEDCIMFTRDEVGFCAACRGAIEQVIELYSK